MRRAWRVVGLAVAAAALAGTAVLSQWPWQAEDSGRSLLRISWRARGERIENCRPATAGELAALPAHMRQETICEDPRVAPYRLRVAVDGRSLVDGAAPGSGATSSSGSARRGGAESRRATYAKSPARIGSRRTRLPVNANSALATAGAIGEVVAGAFLILGLLTPLAAAGLLAVLINAWCVRQAAEPGLQWFAPDGPELELLLVAMLVAIILAGPGRISVEGRRKWATRPHVGSFLALVLGVAGGVCLWIFLNGANPLS